MKIIDAFIFYNEINLLEYRLKILYSQVDHFIIVESTHSFAGHPKKLYFRDNIERFEPYLDNITHIIVDDLPYKAPNINYERSEAWQNEYFQRNAIDRGVQKLTLDSADLIIISDADEIPRPGLLAAIKRGDLILPDITNLIVTGYYYNLNSRVEDIGAPFPKIVRFEFYKRYPHPQTYRTAREFPGILRAGWHLSYFGNEKFIKNKLENFAHQEYNKEEYKNTHILAEKINNSSDLCNREGFKITYVPLHENDDLPPLYEMLTPQLL